jgi:hypothetical protein
MLSSEDDVAQERIPPGHCWVLADNEQLEPPDVIDSRAFGYLDMSLIQGRVIYRVSWGMHVEGGGEEVRPCTGCSLLLALCRGRLSCLHVGRFLHAFSLVQYACR